MAELVRLFPLNGGLNDGLPAQLIEPGEAAATDRIDFNQGGIRSVDTGCVKLSRRPPRRASLRFGVESETVHAPVFIPHHPTYEGLTGSWTVNARIWRDTDPAADGDRQALFTVGGPNTVDDRIQFFLKRVAGKVFLGYSRNGAAEIVDTTKVIWKRREYLVAIRWTGAAAQIVVDGVQVLTNASSFAFAVGQHAALYVGGRQTDSTTALKPFRGRIEELALWKASLSDATLASYVSTPVEPTAANLVGLWRFHDGIGHRCEDLSVTANDGYFAGGVIATQKREGLMKGAIWLDGEEEAVEIDLRNFDVYDQWSKGWKNTRHRWSYAIGFVLGRLPGTGLETVLGDLRADTVANKLGRLSLTATGAVKAELQDAAGTIHTWTSSNTIAPDAKRHTARLARTGETTAALFLDGTQTNAVGPLDAGSIPSGIVIVGPPTHLRVGGSINGAAIGQDVGAATMMEVDEIRLETDSADILTTRRVKDDEIRLSLGSDSVKVVRQSTTVSQGTGPVIVAAAAKNLLVIDGETLSVPVDQDLDGTDDAFETQAKLYAIASVAGGGGTLTLDDRYGGLDASPGAKYTTFVALFALDDTTKEQTQANGVPEAPNPNFTYVSITRGVWADRGPAKLILNFVQSHSSHPKSPHLFVPRWSEGILEWVKTPVDSIDAYEKRDGSKFLMSGVWTGLRRFDDRWRTRTPFDAILYPKTRSIAFEQKEDRVEVARSGTRIALDAAGDQTIEGWFYLNALGGAQTLWCLADPEDALKINAHLYVTASGEVVLKWGDGATTRSFTSPKGIVPVKTLVHWAVVRSNVTVTVKIAGRGFTTTGAGAGNPWAPGSTAAWIGNCPSVQLADGGVLDGTIANPRFSLTAVYGAGDYALPTIPLTGGDETWPFDDGEDVFVRGTAATALPGEILSQPFVSVIEGRGRQTETAPNGVTYQDIFYWTNGAGPPVFFDGTRAAEIGILPPVGKLRVKKKAIVAWSDAVKAYSSLPDEKKLAYSLRFEGLTFVEFVKGNSSFGGVHERDEAAAAATKVTTVSFKGYWRPSALGGRRVIWSVRDGLKSINVQLSAVEKKLELRWWDTKQKAFVGVKTTNDVLTVDRFHYLYGAVRFGDPDGADEAAGGGAAPYKGPVLYVFDDTAIPAGNTTPARPALDIIGSIAVTATNKDSPTTLTDAVARLGGDGFEDIDPAQTPFVGYIQSWYAHQATNAGGDLVSLDKFSGVLKELSKKTSTYGNMDSAAGGDAAGVWRFNDGKGTVLKNTSAAAVKYGDGTYTYRKPMAALKGTYRFALSFKDGKDATLSLPSPTTSVKVDVAGEGEQEAITWFEVGDIPAAADIYRSDVRVVLYRSGLDGAVLTKGFELEQRVDETIADSFNDADLAIPFAGSADKTLSTLFGRPPVARFSQVGEERLFLGGIPDDSDARYSEAFSPQAWPAANRFTTESEDGSGQTGLGHRYGELVIFKQDAAFSVGLLGQGFGSIRRIEGEGGCVAHGSIVTIRTSLFFLGERGLYRLTEGIEYVGQKLEGTWRKVERKSLPLASAALHLDRNEYLALVRRKAARYSRLQIGLNLRWPHAPPQTTDGPELTAIAAVDEADEAPKIYGATPWGLIVRLATGEIDLARDGSGYLALDGLKVGAGATTTVVPVTGGTLATTGKGHYGTPVLVGAGRSVILSNTASQLTLDSDLALGAAPTETEPVVIGGYVRRWTSAILQWRSFDRKLFRKLRSRFRKDDGMLEVFFRPDYGLHKDERLVVDLSKAHVDDPLELPEGAKRATALQVILERKGIKKPFEVYDLAIEVEELGN